MIQKQGSLQVQTSKVKLFWHISPVLAMHDSLFLVAGPSFPQDATLPPDSSAVTTQMPSTSTGNGQEQREKAKHGWKQHLEPRCSGGKGLSNNRQLENFRFQTTWDTSSWKLLSRSNLLELNHLNVLAIYSFLICTLQSRPHLPSYKEHVWSCTSLVEQESHIKRRFNTLRAERLSHITQAKVTCHAMQTITKAKQTQRNSNENTANQHKPSVAKNGKTQRKYNKNIEVQTKPTSTKHCAQRDELNLSKNHTKPCAHAVAIRLLDWHLSVY